MKTLLQLCNAPRRYSWLRGRANARIVYSARQMYTNVHKMYTDSQMHNMNENEYTRNVQ